NAREPLRPAPARDDSEVHLRLAELRVARRVADVARERELAAAAEREAVHRRDRRLRHRLQQPSRFVSERAPGLCLPDVEAAHVLDVGAGGERLIARAGEDDRAHVVVAGDVLQTVAQLRQRLDVERVERLLPVDGEDCDRRIAADADQLTGTFPLRKSTISLVAAPGPTTSATPATDAGPRAACRRAERPCVVVRAPVGGRPWVTWACSTSRMRGPCALFAAVRTERPAGSAGGWLDVSTIWSCVWWRPV